MCRIPQIASAAFLSACLVALPACKKSERGAPEPDAPPTPKAADPFPSEYLLFAHLDVKSIRESAAFAVETPWGIVRERGTQFEVRLEPGVAVVVGPNGSGKSNIADAIVWAAGSLSPSELRAEKPDDVLYAGSKDKPAAGWCDAAVWPASLIM